MAALYDGDDNRVFTASRKEDKNTYQLFQRKPKDAKSGRKSPYTAPSGEENSLFWYGFSQNVLQALSTLPQTVGSIWHSIFDDVSRAYHQKVAKDRATKDGQVVASTSYHLYGARKTSKDTTGNPFAYNGEARDDTGLDYLRARYYDSQGGTFLTEDSYPGEDTDPLSQNRYSYVQNNPVNYTDPSGHFWNSIKKGWNYVKKTASNAWNGVKRVASNTWNTVKRVASNTWNGVKSFASKAWNVTKSAFNHATNWVSTQYNRAVNWGSRQWNKVQTAYNSASDYVQTVYQQAAAQIEAKRQQVVRSAYAIATGIKSSPSIREGLNLYRNWNTALENTLKHVCDPKTTKGQDDASKKKLTASELQELVKKANSGDMSAVGTLSRSYDGKSGIGTGIRTKEEIEAGNKLVWENIVDGFEKIPYVIGEFFSVNDVYRLITGKDPLTGEDASRSEAAGWLLLDVLTVKISKIAKGAKAASKGLQALDAINDASKAAKAADRAKDASKVAKAVDKASDAARVADKVKDSIPKINYSDLPTNVQNSYKKYSDIKWEGNFKGQTEGTAAGKKFKNADNSLPNIDKHDSPITYKEFDVNNKLPSKGRDGERFVRGSDGSVYYTDDHYKTFKQIK